MPFLKGHKPYPRKDTRTEKEVEKDALVEEKDALKVIKLAVPDKPVDKYSHLHKWQPGQSGNPAGRPKKKFSITASLEKCLQEKDKVTKIRNYKMILHKAIDLAKTGDSGMIQYLINRIEGVPQGTAPQTNVQINYYTESDRLEIAYKLVANNNGIPVEIMKEYLKKYIEE